MSRVSLSSFLARLIWLGLTPLMLLAAWLAFDSVQQTRVQRDQDAANLAKNFATAIDQHLAARIGALNILAVSPLVDDPARWPELYREAQGFRESFGSHVILADVGEPMHMLFNTRAPFGAALPLLPRPKGHAAAPMAVETGRPAVGDIFFGPVAKQPLVAIAVPALRHGQATHLLLTIFETTRFQQRLDMVALPDGWAMSLLDGRGEVIARRAPPGFAGLHQADAAGRHAGKLTKSPWAVVLEIPPEVRLAPLFSVAIALAAGVGGATLIGILGGMLAARRLERQVAGLAVPAISAAEPSKIVEIAAAHRLLAETAEQAQASEDRFRAIFNGMLDAVVYADTGRHIQLVNPAFTRLFGYTVEEVAGRTTDFLYADPADYAEQGRRRYSLTASGDSAPCEIRYRRKDGSEFWADSVGTRILAPDGAMLGFMGMHRDISERRQAALALAESQASALEYQHQARLAALNQMEDANVARRNAEAISKALRESQERLQLLIDHAPASLAMFDRDMRYLAVSRRWLGDYGIGDRNLLGLSHYQVFPELTEAVKDMHRRGLAGEILRNDEDRFVRADGQVQWLRWEMRPWRAADGGVGGIVIFSEEITRLVEAKQEVLQLNATLEQRVEQRTAELTAANQELDSFAYAVSHDLRAPLRAMSGFSQALVEDFGGQLAVEAREYLEQIIQASHRMSDLIDGILALSRTTRGEMLYAPVDLSGLSRHVFTELSRTEPERRVSTQVEPGLVTSGDARMLEAALRNLLGNAWKYSAHAQAPAIHVFAEERDGRRWFCVADNGAGFDMAHAARLFQPFQRLHRQEEFPGLGIGLATVQRIIHRHGGTIEASGEPGQGAIFRFSLPGGQSTSEEYAS